MKKLALSLLALLLLLSSCSNVQPGLKYNDLYEKNVVRNTTIESAKAGFSASFKQTSEKEGKIEYDATGNKMFGCELDTAELMYSENIETIVYRSKPFSLEDNDISVYLKNFDKIMGEIKDKTNISPQFDNQSDRWLFEYALFDYEKTAKQARELLLQLEIEEGEMLVTVRWKDTYASFVLQGKTVQFIFGYERLT